jgi:hypothetical protein
LLDDQQNRTGSILAAFGMTGGGFFAAKISIGNDEAEFRLWVRHPRFPDYVFLFVVQQID